MTDLLTTDLPGQVGLENFMDSALSKSYMTVVSVSGVTSASAPTILLIVRTVFTTDGHEALAVYKQDNTAAPQSAEFAKLSYIRATDSELLDNGKFSQPLNQANATVYLNDSVQETFDQKGQGELKDTPTITVDTELGLGSQASQLCITSGLKTNEAPEYVVVQPAVEQVSLNLGALKGRKFAVRRACASTDETLKVDDETGGGSINSEANGALKSWTPGVMTKLLSAGGASGADLGFGSESKLVGHLIVLRNSALGENSQLLIVYTLHSTEAADGDTGATMEAYVEVL
jgi:hypothetical protein